MGEKAQERELYIRCDDGILHSFNLKNCVEYTAPKTTPANGKLNHELGKLSVQGYLPREWALAYRRWLFACGLIYNRHKYNKVLGLAYRHRKHRVRKKNLKRLNKMLADWR